MKKILLILLVFSYAVSNAQLIQLNVTSKNKVAGIDTLFLNPKQIFYAQKGATTSYVWVQDVNLGKAVVYGTVQKFDTIVNQSNRQDFTLVKLLKADKVSGRDTAIQYAVSPYNIIYAKTKSNATYPIAKSQIAVKLGANPIFIPIVETRATILSRIDSLFNASYVTVTNP